MKPVLVNGELWQVNRVSPGDPILVDRTGVERIATTDPVSRSINISNEAIPPMLDRVLLHEVAHAITVSYGLLPSLRMQLPPDLWVLVEEWAVELLEKYSIEAIIATSESLGRPVCVSDQCL